MKFFFAGILFFIYAIVFSQNTDSLVQVLKNTKQDTVKLRLLVQLSEEVDNTEILKYAQPAVALADKILSDKNLKPDKTFILKLKAAALCNVGYAYRNQSEVNNAIFYYNLGLKILDEIHDSILTADVLSNLGNLYYQHGNVTKSLEYYDKCLKLQEEVNNKSGIADAFNDIANVYLGQGEANKALEYCKNALKIQKGIGDSVEIARSYNNIGAIYSSQKNYTAALEQYNLSLKILVQQNYEEGIAHTLSNIGSIFQRQDDVKNALLNFNKSIQLHKKTENLPGIAVNQLYIGSIYYSLAKKSEDIGIKRKNLSLSKSYLDSSLVISEQLGYAENIRNIEEKLAKVDSMSGNYEGAFNHYRQFINFRDKINNEKTRKAAIKSQLNYEFEKKEAVIKEQQEKERAIASEQSYIQKIIITCVLLGFLLVAGFALFIFRSLKFTRHQKEIIEEKQKEILDSIHYAKRIQTSLLPTEKYIGKKLK